MKDNIRTIYYYIKHFEAIQHMRKTTPNDSVFAANIRSYLYKLENEKQT